MSVIDILLNAQRRSSPEESRRITAAVDAALTSPLRDTEDSARATVAQAEAAYRRVVREIADEKNLRLTPPVAHTAVFEDDPHPGALIADAEPGEDASVRNDSHFTLAGPPTPPTSGVEDPLPGHGFEVESDEAQADFGAVTSPVGPTDPFGEATPMVNVDEDPDKWGEEARRGAGANGARDDAPARAGRAVGGPAAVGDPWAAEPPRIPSGIPSPTDLYAGVEPWGNDAELDPAAPAATTPAAAKPDPTAAPAATAAAPGPKPSPRATEPPADFGRLEPDPEPGLRQRLRDSPGSALSRLRAGEVRSKALWLAAGVAAVLVIAVAAVFSLSGSRGRAPVPAGVAVAPPAQTENPTPAPDEAPLVPATVSARCVGDSDAVAPFAGEKSRAWVCGRANGLDGAVLNITFNQPMVITAITLVPGFNYVAPDGRDEWERHRLVTGVTWRMGGKPYPQPPINPTRTGVTTKFEGVVTQEMSMTITASVRPPRVTPSGIGKPGSGSAGDVDETTAISSIVITGYPYHPAGG